MIKDFPVYESDTNHYNDWFDLTGEWEIVAEGVRFRTFSFTGTPSEDVDGAFVEILPGHRTPVQLVASDHTFTETPFGGKLTLFHIKSDGKLSITRFDPDIIEEGSIAVEVKKGDLMFWYCDPESETLGEVIEYEVPGFNSAELPTVNRDSKQLEGKEIPASFWEAVELIDSGNDVQLKQLIKDNYNGDIRYNRLFGEGKLFPDDTDLESFFQLPIEQQAYIMGWSHACPVIEEVIEIYGNTWKEQHPDAKAEDIAIEGARMALKRYAECNFVYGLIDEQVRRDNLPLWEQLSSPIRRRPDEPFILTERRFVPDTAIDYMSPMSTPVGYALPRILIEMMGRGDDRNPDRYKKATDYLEFAIGISRNPIEFVVILSELAVTKNGIDPKVVLGHLLSVGVLNEQNCTSMYREINNQIRAVAPRLFQAYSELSESDMDEEEIAKFPFKVTL